MTVVEPTSKRSTHHLMFNFDGDDIGLILCDPNGNADISAGLNVSKYPRSSIKMYSGEQKNSDSEPPFSAKEQRTYVAGRGQEDLDDNASKFFDSFQVDTTRDGYAILGPQPVYCSSHRLTVQAMPYKDTANDDAITYTWVTLASTTRFIAIHFTPGETMNAAELWLTLRYVGSPGALSYAIYTNNSGVPGTVVGSVKTIAASSLVDSVYPDGLVGRTVPLSFGSSYSSLTASTTYWVVIYGAATDDSDKYWQVLCSYAGQAKKSSAGSSWTTDTSVGPFFRLHSDPLKKGKGFFFEFYNQLYCLMRYDYNDVYAPKLMINGDRGISQGTLGDAEYLYDSSKAWTTDEWRGCIVKIIIGTGSSQAQNWRMIKSNTATRLDVTPNWDVAPGADTEYVILGSDKWTDITPSSPAYLNPSGDYVSDVLVTNRAAYFAMGDNADMVRMREYNSAGTWTREFATETGNKASVLRTLSDSDGNTQIWKARSTPYTGVCKADPVWCGGSGSCAALSFDSEVIPGEPEQRINNMTVYGNEGCLYVFKEGEIYYWTPQYKKFSRLVTQGLKQLGGDQTGAVTMVWNMELYFQVLDRWQRYYSSYLDDVTPEGVYQLRKAQPGAAVEYAGRYFLALDGGTSNYSSIVCFNDQGWHEVYRAPAVGLRIRSMYIQTIPGDTVDRLWFSVGADLAWIPIHLTPKDAPSAPGYGGAYRFANEGYIITSRIQYNRAQLKKLFHALAIVAENLSSTVYVYADYRLDGDTAWTAIGTKFNTPLGQKVEFTSSTISGRRIQFRLRFYTNSNRSTPVLKAWVLYALIREELKNQYTIRFRLRDDGRDLNGDPEVFTPDQVISSLSAMAQDTERYTVSSVTRLLDGKTVIVESGSVRLVNRIQEDNAETEIYEMTLFEV